MKTRSLFAIVFILIALVFGLKMRGLVGALILGCAALVLDYCILKHRFQLFPRLGKSRAAFVVVFAFLLRILNVIIFVLISFWWLKDDVKMVFTIILATIPLFNLLTVYCLTNS